jgi:hypothetical protein
VKTVLILKRMKGRFRMVAATASRKVKSISSAFPRGFSRIASTGP